jgi:hypothetical protein
MDNHIEYDAGVQFLQAKGIVGLNNGLDVNDNEVLFRTTNIPEMIFLILKGLTKKFSWPRTRTTLLVVSSMTQ